jgi:hypothetical protein
MDVATALLGQPTLEATVRITPIPSAGTPGAHELADRFIAAQQRRRCCGAEASAAPPAPDGAELLRELENFLVRFVIFTSKAAQRVPALWVLHTHAFKACEATPYLGIVSPTNRWGHPSSREVGSSRRSTIHWRWSKMCHERWMRRERRREERYDDELRRLIDEDRPRPNRPLPVVERERDEEPRDPERVRVQAGTRS